ncbi:transposase, partial [Oligoflexus sp.]|uniref:transposase n=1 Tax=Oligoflexus sp. TaxID=1971216 RepID=UPI0039C93813
MADITRLPADRSKPSAYRLAGIRCCGLVGRLYLPQSWIDDQKKLDECGVPKSRRIFKTKWRIALDLLAPLTSER